MDGMEEKPLEKKRETFRLSPPTLRFLTYTTNECPTSYVVWKSTGVPQHSTDRTGWQRRKMRASRFARASTMLSMWYSTVAS